MSRTLAGATLLLATTVGGLRLAAAPRRAAVRAALTVCTGGACAEFGADLILDASHAMSCGASDDLEVKGVFCSGECPDGVMLCPSKGSIDAYVAQGRTVDEALSAVSDALEQAGEPAPAPALRAAFAAKAAGDAAARAGEHAAAAAFYADCLGGVDAALLAPAQPALAAEPTAWAGTKWEVGAAGDELAVGADGATGSCGPLPAPGPPGKQQAPDAAALALAGCVEDGAARTLRGTWAGGGDGGAFALAMAADGRSFDGTRTGAAGAPVPWAGGRKGVGTGMRRRRRGEPPPARVSWLHAALLGRSKALLALGEAGAAAEAARGATELCCRVASGWAALGRAEADEAAAKAARREAAWLDGFA